jgi:hypothetical protein
MTRQAQYIPDWQSTLKAHSVVHVHIAQQKH